MTEEELRQTVESLRGHARWLRNYAGSPRKYHDPFPAVPDALDNIADRLAGSNAAGQSVPDPR